jgi:hypothetical protein
MSKKAVLLISVLVLLTTGFQQPKPKVSQPTGQGMKLPGVDTAPVWHLFSPKGGGFSVMLPGKPAEETIQVDSATGPFTRPTYRLASGEFGYMITYSEYTNVPEETQARNDFIQMAAEKAVNMPGGKLTSSKPISLGDYPGREVKAEIRGPSILQVNTYFARPRVYLVMVFMPLDKTDSEYVTKYFASFKILPAQETRPTVQPC